MPTALKMLRGGHPDRINRNEPRPPAGPVTKPDWLSPDAETEWDRIAGTLEQIGVLTSHDETLFAFYCESVALARRFIFECGPQAQALMLKDGRGGLVRNAVYAYRRDTVLEALRFGKEFGLTPASRSQLRVDPVVADAAERLLTKSG